MYNNRLVWSWGRVRIGSESSKLNSKPLAVKYNNRSAMASGLFHCHTYCTQNYINKVKDNLNWVCFFNFKCSLACKEIQLEVRNARLVRTQQFSIIFLSFFLFSSISRAHLVTARNRWRLRIPQVLRFSISKCMKTNTKSFCRILAISVNIGIGIGFDNSATTLSECWGKPKSNRESGQWFLRNEDFGWPFSSRKICSLM